MCRARERLEERIREVPAQIRSLPPHWFDRRPEEGKWSGKEILGHLCDSALTNLQRFVRAQYEPQPYAILKYEQDKWVSIMDYHHQPVEDILSLWTSLNRQVSVVMAGLSEEELDKVCSGGPNGNVTLAWLADDYVDHLDHHLAQIFARHS
ncbi:DinB family protein [Paenibacillus sp. P22]|uniref:DinB family protein n=1 Tax=Paenibacillus TaxID=44249 RepID=UPI0004183DA6|nr:DinB family protein [Paenibacillus sp. P22]CDN45141.1 Putative metal-dependent hydrolase [Paenibacillus sp. P22]